jgi:nucleotidyltransferase/DNA polymerase involved in DNA repair
MSILFVDIPRFLVTAHRRADPSLTDKPLLVHRDRKVLDRCELAKHAGVRLGMSLTEARSMLGPELVCREFEPDIYAPLQREWLEIATEYADLIEPTPEPGAANLDLSPHPFPALVASRFLAALTQLGHRVRACLSPTKWVSRALVPPEGLREVQLPGLELVREPVGRLLPVSPEARQRLEFLGYRRIGEVQRLSMETLRTQFPEEALIIQQAANGAWSEAVLPLYPLHSRADRFVFSPAIDDAERLERAFRRLAKCFAQHLSDRDEQGNILELWVHFEGKEAAFATSRTFSRPLSRAREILTGLLLLYSPGEAGTEASITEIRLRMRDLKPTSRRQTMLPGLPLRDEQAGEVALARIRQKFGQGAVLRATEVQLPRRKAVLKAWGDAVGWH